MHVSAPTILEYGDRQSGGNVAYHVSIDAPEKFGMTDDMVDQLLSGLRAARATTQRMLEQATTRGHEPHLGQEIKVSVDGIDCTLHFSVTSRDSRLTPDLLERVFDRFRDRFIDNACRLCRDRLQALVPAPV